MADFNHFGALNQDEDTCDTFQEGEQKDATFFVLKSLVTDGKVKLPEAQVDQNENRICLLACSSKYGYFVAATANGFCLGPTEKMRKTIYQASRGKGVLLEDLIQVKVKQGRINHVSLSADQLELFVAVVGGLLLTYNVHDAVHHKELASPSQVYEVGCEITSILPNPEAYPDIIAVHTKENRCELIQNNNRIATMHDVHSICWSRKGKQIACGSSSGSIIAYDIHGSQKNEIAPPTAFPDGDESKRIVDTIIWLENKLFLAIYTKKEQDDEDIHTPYIVDNTKTTDDEKFVLMDEIIDSTAMQCPNAYFYSAVVRNIGPEAKTIIIFANSAATELNIVGQDDDDKWATWMMEPTPVLPLSTDCTSDTYPVGLAVDYSASEPLPPFNKDESDTPVAPMPVLYVMTTEGFLLSYHIYNKKLAESGVQYEDMVEAQDLYTIPLPQKPAATTSFGNAESKIPTSISKNEKFPNTFPLNDSSNTFGSFGNGSTPQKFATLARTSSTETKLSKPVYTLGNASTFGQSSGFGQPGFGTTTAFGSPTAAVNAPVFGGFKNMVETPKKSNSITSDKSFSEISLVPFKLESDDKPTSVFAGIPVFSPDEKSKNSLSAVSDDKSEQGRASPSMQTKSGRDEHVPPTTKEKDDGCSMSFEQVQRVLEEKDVDVRSSGSEFSKTDSNQEDKDYLDEENQTNSDQESTNEEDKLTAEKRTEDERVANGKRLAQEKHAVEAKRLEDQRIAETKRVEEERIAEEESLEAERLAAIKPDLKFSIVPRDNNHIEPFTRSKGLTPMAAVFEDIYFSTLEDMKSTAMLLRNTEADLYARNKDIFNPVHAETFTDFGHVWKIADSESISQIVDDLHGESKLAQLNAQFDKERTAKLLEDTAMLINDQNIINEYLERHDFDTPLENADLSNELETKQNYLQATNRDIDALFAKVDSKLAQIKEQSTKSLPPTKYSKMKRFELEKIVRDIQRDINTRDDKVYQLATEELNFRAKNKD